MKPILTLLLATALVACAKPTKTTQNTVVPPPFSADSAYRFVVEQLRFGARVPDTKGHTDCIFYLVQKLKSYGAAVTLQQGFMTNYEGKQQSVYNIIGHFAADPALPSVLLCAHYDTRPWCDEVEEYNARFQPVPGANDGASGVAVLLEVGRQIALGRDSADASKNPKTRNQPVDIVFFDCEDMGTPAFYTGQQRPDTWCLGSQLWAREFAYGPTEPVSNQYAYGILLDMVGAPDALFPKELYSQQYASDYLERIWRQAAKLGHAKYFSDNTALPITDDHFYINTVANIPCVDIIHYDTRNNSGFPFWWHTPNDNIKQVDQQTLAAVGETVLSCLKY